MTITLVYDFPVPEKGPHLQPRYLAGLGFDAGWTNADKLLVATSVCLAEGNGYIHAVHVNVPAVLDDQGNVIETADEDWGLWQINNKAHPEVTQAQAFDPVFATQFARKLYVEHSSTFSPWAAYTNGAWKGPQALGYALDGVRNYLAMKHNVYGTY